MGQNRFERHVVQDFWLLLAVPRMWKNRLVLNRKRSTSRLYIVTLLIELICRVHHEKRWAGRTTSWNQFKIVGRNINNLRYADDTTLMTESEEELKSLWMKVKKEMEKFV